MRFKKLDLNLLVAFDHMISARSVSVAAEKMHMSQSAMSNALTRLRTYFDDPLLVQVGRRMELTPRAEALRAPVRDILVRLEATIEARPEFLPIESTREFTILLSDYTQSVFIPHVLRLARDEAPGVRFRLQPQIAHPYSLLEKGEADVLIAPAQFCSPEHPSEHLFSDSYVCLVWSEGIWANAELTEAAYLKAGHAVATPPRDANSVETLTLAGLGIERSVEVATFSFSALPQMVVGTDRVATVHRRLARQVLPNLPLVEKPLPFQLNPLNESMQWHSYRSHDPGLKWLRGLFNRAAERMEMY